jgi:hypothetical protein
MNFEEQQDKAVTDIIKVYIAQMNSAIKISKILCKHSGENEVNELTGDHIIAGLIYRLMVPITDEDMIDSLNTAEDILNGDDSDDDGYESEDDIEYTIPDERRKLKVNNCPCEICTKCRECISKYDSYETYDLLTTRFKDSIKETCDKHNIYIN